VNKLVTIVATSEDGRRKQVQKITYALIRSIE